MTTEASDSMEPSDPKSDVSRAVARRIGQVLGQVVDKSWQEAAGQFGDLESELLPLCATDADKLEVKRRICESILSELSLAEPSPDRAAYEAVWQRMLRLGFSNAERRMSMMFYRLTYLIQRTEDSVAIEAELSIFHEHVQVLLKQPEHRMGEHFARVHQTLRDKFGRKSQ